jgi:acetyltransferase-like isoleucine patch superfamily enzyme
MIASIRLANALAGRIFRLLHARSFASFGANSQIIRPIGIEQPGRIHLGADVYVAAQSCLAVQPLDESAALVIGDGCKLGRFNHIYATGHVELGPKVLTANGVYISDNLHGYDDPATAVMDQPLVQKPPTRIGEGSWIGHNACIVGATLGRQCVVGANAVVTRDAPDYSVIVGVPGIVIRRYDLESRKWRATEADGSFRAA